MVYIPNINFKGFMANSGQANCNMVKMICGDGDSNLPMVACEHTCLFHRSTSLDKMIQKYIKPSLQFQHKQISKNYKNPKR